MRTLIPVRQISPEQHDFVRESIETDLLKKAAMARSEITDWRVRQLLPWTDLGIVSAGQAGTLTDFWGCGALVASTALIYVNHILENTEFIAIYGIQIRDTNPAVIKALFQTGVAASTMAHFNIENMYAAQEPELITPEYLYYAGNARVYVQLIPDAVGKAVGADGVSDHVVLLGLMCQPAGEVISV